MNNTETYTYSELLGLYIDNPSDPIVNFYLGFVYQEMGQTASAVSFYLRSAERTDYDLLKYECLIRASMCFDSQGSRGDSVIGLLQHAVALLPKRPEAYYLLSRYYERIEKWFEGYMLASIGEKVTEQENTKLNTSIDYPGFYGILFEKAVCGWWCGLCDESIEILKDLSVNYPLDKIHRNAVKNNIERLVGHKKDEEFISFLKNKEQEISIARRDLSLYVKESGDKLIHKFTKSSTLDQNYSEAFQDLFVLTVLDGKKEGTYVEIGAGFPFYGNNTYLLESEFNWNGVSIDIEQESIERYFRDRNNLSIMKDGTKVDYDKLFTEYNIGKNIDYLQLDCDPPSITYDILLKIPFDKYKFKVITYEHDDYQDVTGLFKELSRKYLKSKGYELVISNISVDGVKNFEDWYVHSDLRALDIVKKLKNTDDSIKKIKNIFVK